MKTDSIPRADGLVKTVIVTFTDGMSERWQDKDAPEINFPAIQARVGKPIESIKIMIGSALVLVASVYFD